MSLINLLPDDYIRRRQHQRANALCLTLFLIVMLGLGAAVLVSERSTRYTRQVAEMVEAAYADATKLIEQLQELEGQKQKMLQKAERTASLLERVPRSTLLAIVTNAMPEEVSLTRFQLIPKQIIARADAGAAGDPDSKFQRIQAQRNDLQTTQILTIEVDGLTATDVEVAHFIANLNRNPLLTGVDLVYSQEKKSVGSATIREFQVRMEVKQNVDVMDVLQTVQDQPVESAKAPAPGGPGRNGT
jgi:Tfp pilus assembly protein PilN